MYREEKQLNGFTYRRSTPNGKWKLVEEDTPTFRLLECLKDTLSDFGKDIPVGQKRHFEKCINDIVNPTF